jgi:hypothetical protein
MLLEQILAELESVKAAARPAVTTKTMLPMGAVLDPVGNGVDYGAFKALTRKHTVAGTSNELGVSLNETAFFVDCALEAPIINLTAQPRNTLLGIIPNERTNLTEIKVGFLTGLNDGTTGAPQDEPCDDAEVLDTSYTFCKVSLPIARRQIRTKTGEIDVLIEKACRGIYTDFYVVGDVRGVSATPSMQFTPNDSNLIIEGALMNNMKGKARVFNKWIQTQLYTGDPANNTAGGGYKEFIGLDLLLSGNYPVDMAPYLEGSAAVGDCAALNSDLKNFGGECLGGGVNSIYEFVQEADHTVMIRSHNSDVERGGLLMIMHPIMLKGFSDSWTCEEVGYGCAGAVTNANDGGSGTYALDGRNRILNERTVTVNGNVYSIVLDNNIEITEVTPGTYESKIYGIPRTLNGEVALKMQSKDYRAYQDVLAPVNGMWNESVGWSDGGNYLHTIERKVTCFEVVTKTEPRLYFNASRFSWVISAVRACYLQAKEIA